MLSITRAVARVLRATLRKIADWCRTHFHEPLADQCRTLGQKIRGHCAYYGLTGNAAALQSFRTAVVRTWHKWLGRRHRKGSLSWPSFLSLLARFPLPRATVVHSVYRGVAPST